MEIFKFIMGTFCILVVLLTLFGNKNCNLSDLFLKDLELAPKWFRIVSPISFLFMVIVSFVAVGKMLLTLVWL